MKKGQLTFTRMSGAKNTFFIVDCTGDENLGAWHKLSLSEKENMAQKLCLGFDDNHTDGLIFLVPNQKPDEKTDFAWQFFNADGSHADMCGNAARCVTLFAGNKMVLPKKQMTFFKTFPKPIEWHELPRQRDELVEKLKAALK